MFSSTSSSIGTTSMGCSLSPTSAQSSILQSMKYPTGTDFEHPIFYDSLAMGAKLDVNAMTDNVWCSGCRAPWWRSGCRTRCFQTGRCSPAQTSSCSPPLSSGWSRAPLRRATRRTRSGSALLPSSWTWPATSMSLILKSTANKRKLTEVGQRLRVLLTSPPNRWKQLYNIHFLFYSPPDLMCAILQADQYAKPKSWHQLAEEGITTKYVKLYEHCHPCRYHGRARQDA